MNIRNILVFSTFILCCQGISISVLDIKIKYCRFRCDDTCEPPEDKSNTLGDAPSPKDYYWRDFHGMIPPDAYPLGAGTQFPQTYIGLVYDPSNNGTFVTTIYDGLGYVYNAFKNGTTKIDKHIQILCTKSPGNLSWMKLTNANVKNVLATRKIVQGAYHMELVQNFPKAFNHFIVKANKCHVTYTGSVHSLHGKLEYALIDGSSDTTDQFLWLLYNKEKPAKNNESGETCTSKRSFSHHYDYAIRPDSIVPKFYKQINIGSCSLTCTNEDKIGMRKFKNDINLSASMAYYWKPKPVIRKEEALLAGKDYKGSLYVGQAYLSTNNFDVGPSELSAVEVNAGFEINMESQYYHVLSSNYPEKLEWVNTSTQEFPQRDKNKMIPGGAFDNGTETFVCRDVGEELTLPGSARVLPTGTFCYAMLGILEKFQILMYDEDKR